MQCKECPLVVYFKSTQEYVCSLADPLYWLDSSPRLAQFVIARDGSSYCFWSLDWLKDMHTRLGRLIQLREQEEQDEVQSFHEAVTQ